MAATPQVQEIWELIKETQNSIKETRESIKETRESIKETRESIKELSAETSQQIKKDSAETSQQIKKNFAETGQQIKKNFAETGQYIKKLSVETDKLRASQKETGQYIKKLSIETEKTDKGLRKTRQFFESQWGKLMESLVKGDLVKLLNKKGIDVDSSSSNMEGVYEGKNWEFDIVAVNGKEIVLVEVKTTLKVKDVEYFTEKLKFFTTWKPEYKGKIIYGAVAYLRAEESASRYAEKQGLFVIRATGSSSSIINKKSFKPKAFFNG